MSLIIKQKNPVGISYRAVICLTIIALMAFISLTASAGWGITDNTDLTIVDMNSLENVDLRIVDDTDLTIIDMNSFEYFVTSHFDWVKEDPTTRHLEFTLGSNNSYNIVNYAKGKLKYISATDEHLFGESTNQVNTREWSCPDDVASDPFDDSFNLNIGPDYSFDPDATDDISISIFTNEKIIINGIDGSPIVLTADFGGGVLYGFYNGTMYTLGLQKFEENVHPK